MLMRRLVDPIWPRGGDLKMMGFCISFKYDRAGEDSIPRLAWPVIYNTLNHPFVVRCPRLSESQNKPFSLAVVYGKMGQASDVFFLFS